MNDASASRWTRTAPSPGCARTREKVPVSRSVLRRACGVTLTTVAVTTMVAAPTPALAADMFFSRSSGTVASTSWLEIGELPPAANAPGNAHFGELQVEDLGRGRARAFGLVFDVQCQDGVTPYLPGGGHGGGPVPPGAEPPVETCVLQGVRFIEGGSALTFTIDRKLTSATLTGALTVSSGHGEGPVGAPPVNITWTGVGSSYSSNESGSFTDEFGTYSYRYSFNGRDANIAAGSRIGPMVFDDEAGESSTGQLGSYRESSRSRS